MKPIITRIRALLALGESANPNEAANAMAAAQKLMVENELSMTEVQTGDANQFAEVAVCEHLKVPTWQKILLMHIAAACDCVLLKTGGKGHAISHLMVGSETDAECAKHMLAYALAEVERHTQKCPRRGRTAKDSFRRGMVDRMGVRLREQKQALESVHTTALARRQDRRCEIQSWLIREGCLKTVRRAKAQSVDVEAYTLGQIAGNQVDLGSKKLE